MNSFKKYLELTVWITALLSLAMMEPSGNHFSFCIFRLFGFDQCPGCGIGHSISYLFHGDLSASVSSHPLGIFAVIVILFRISVLIKIHFIKTKNHALR